MVAGTSVRADLVGHWLSGPDNLTDSSGFKPAGTHDGVAIGSNAAAIAFSTDLPTGFTGKSLDLTAGNVAVSVANSATTDAGYADTYDQGVSSKLTVAFWAKGFPGTWAPWVGKRGEDGIGWQVRRFSNSSGACFTMRGIDNEDAGGSSINVNDSPPKWHHYAAVWDQELGSRILYVDGVLSHEVFNATAQSTSLAAAKHLALGARQGGGADYEGYFSGLLFDVRVYNEALSETRVLDLIPPPVPQGLVVTPANLKAGLNWTPSFGATSYTMWTKNTVTNVEQTNLVTAPPYIKTGLTNGVLYQFKVLAANTGSSSAYSAVVSATPSVGTAKDILTFDFPDLGPATISGTTITKQVPSFVPVSDMAPIYTVSPIASQDAAFPSGSARDFSTPQNYKITAEDGSTKIYTVRVIQVDPITFDFNSGLQGWAQIFPSPSAGALLENNALGSGYDPGETRFGRSPEFYLDNSGPLTFQLDGGQSPLGAPGVGPSLIPELAIDGGGFGGVALRDVATNTYLLSRNRSSNGGGYQTFSFTAAEIAPLANNNRKYTLDYIDYNKGGWGWTYMDNVSIPGALAPAANITAISLFGPGGISGNNITLLAPYGTAVTSLAPVFTLSPGATSDKPSGTPLNFSSPVTYTVTSSDLATSRVYTVTVVVLPDPATGLVGQWVAGGTNLTDTSGHTSGGAHDGVAIGSNAAALAYNADDVPLNFSGSSLDLKAGNVGVMIQNTSTTDAGYKNTFDDPLRSHLTVAFWAKGFPGNWAPWVSKGGEDGVGWQLRRMSDQQVSGFTIRSLDNVDGLGSPVNVNDSPAKWHHFAGVWDQSTGNRSLYVDGVLSHDLGNTLGQMMNLATGKHLALGARQTSTEAFDSYFSGLLFDVRIYNQALFASQVQTVMTTSTIPQTPEAKIRSFGLPGLPAVITGNTIAWSLPLTTPVTSLAPTFVLSAGATSIPASGTPRNFSTPQTYTVTSSDSQTTVYTVTTRRGFDFNDNTLQGWHNRVWNGATSAWTDLDPNLTAIPETINEGELLPESSDNGLFAPTNGTIESNGHHDLHLNTLWLRSPVFNLDGSGDLTLQLAKGTAHAVAPTSEAEVPFAAATEAGWTGVVLRRDSDGAFLLSRTKAEGNSDTFYTMTFSKAELAPFVGTACTVELINSNQGGWGWVSMDNVVIPGSSATSGTDPFTNWINAAYPGLSDKSPGGDPDGDGMTNRAEFAYGLNPSSGASVNPIVTSLAPATGTFSYTRRNPALTGMAYTVLTSTNLVTWTTDAGATASQTVASTADDVQTVNVTLTAATPTVAKRFVRIEAK